ncbi:MAG: ABC transporter permease [Anaerolineae bacterium]|nr:ABC transporter permease [Anaerolineae bacterium]
MNIQKVRALVMVEFKKLIRDPMTLAVLVLMPVGLTLIFYVALGNLYSEWDPARPDVSYFEYLVPGTMGYAVIYMGMMIALALAEYRQEGLLKRVGTTPTSPYVYLGSLLLANVLIAVLQGLIVLLVSVILGVHVQIDVLGLVMVCIFLGVLAVTAVRLGLITATIAKSTGAVSGLSMLFIVPMMMFGTFLAVFDENTRAIAHFTPNFYVTESLYLLFSGSGLSEGIIWQNLLILSIVSLVLVVIGIQLFKRTEFR